MLDQAIESAVDRALIGRLREGTRHGFLKRKLLRVLELVTRDQNEFNAAVVMSLEELAATQRRAFHETSAIVNGLAADIAELRRIVEPLRDDGVSLRAAVEALETSVARFRADEHDRSEAFRLENAHRLEEAASRIDAQLGLLGDELSGVRRDAGRVSGELLRQDDRVTILLQEARRRLPQPFDDGQLSTFNQQLERRFDAMYTEFENRYRGSREMILQRLEVYDELIDLSGIVELGPCADLGCGRGEWLEHLRERDIPAYGVDANEEIARSAKHLGLDVRVEDGLEHLRSVQPASLGMVSMFHIAEHLPFETLVDVMRAAHMALAPGGYLVVETPNPLNVRTGAAGFYLDPTHERPLHPSLLEFVAGHTGFEEVVVHFLNPPDAPPIRLDQAQGLDPELARMAALINDAILGPQDSALIARKPTD